MAKIFDLEIINLSTTAYDLEIAFEKQFISHKIYNRIVNSNNNNAIIVKK